MARVIILVYGGVVQEVMSDDKNINVDVIDEDVLEDEEISEELQQYVEGIQKEYEELKKKGFIVY